MQEPRINKAVVDLMRFAIDRGFTQPLEMGTRYSHADLVQLASLVGYPDVKFEGCEIGVTKEDVNAYESD